MVKPNMDIKRIKVYRRLGIITFVFGMFITAITGSLEICPWIPLALFTIFVVITIILMSQYKCPYCGRILEWRISPEKQRYCYQCGRRIDRHQ